MSQEVKQNFLYFKSLVPFVDVLHWSRNEHLSTMQRLIKVKLKQLNLKTVTLLFCNLSFGAVPEYLIFKL